MFFELKIQVQGQERASDAVNSAREIAKQASEHEDVYSVALQCDHDILYRDGCEDEDTF